MHQETKTVALFALLLLSETEPTVSLRYLSSHLKRVASWFCCILKALKIKQQRQKRWGEEVFGALDS